MFDLSTVDILILAGGLGSRLQSVVSDRPKPLATVAGKPFIYYLLKQLKSFNAKNVIISTGYMKEKFDEILIDDYKCGLNITYSMEYDRLGTGGAIKLALDTNKITTNRFIVMNGDSYIDQDLRKFYVDAVLKNKDSSILLYKNKNINERYHLVNFIDDWKIANFVQYPFASYSKKYDSNTKISYDLDAQYINSGVYVFDTEFLKNILAQFDGNFSIEHDVIRHKLLSSLKLKSYISDAVEFIDIGIPEDYEKAQGLFLNK